MELLKQTLIERALWTFQAFMIFTLLMLTVLAVRLEGPYGLVVLLGTSLPILMHLLVLRDLGSPNTESTETPDSPLYTVIEEICRHGSEAYYEAYSPELSLVGTGDTVDGARQELLRRIYFVHRKNPVLHFDANTTYVRLESLTDGAD